MADMNSLNAAIDSLINSVQAEIKRVTVDLQNSRPTDSQGIQDAIGKLNNLTAQLDAVDPATVASGTPPTITPATSTENNPVVTPTPTNTSTSTESPAPQVGNTTSGTSENTTSTVGS